MEVSIVSIFAVGASSHSLLTELGILMASSCH